MTKAAGRVLAQSIGGLCLIAAALGWAAWRWTVGLPMSRDYDGPYRMTRLGRILARNMATGVAASIALALLVSAWWLLASVAVLLGVPAGAVAAIRLRRYWRGRRDRIVVEWGQPIRTDRQPAASGDVTRQMAPGRARRLVATRLERAR